MSVQRVLLSYKANPVDLCLCSVVISGLLLDARLLIILMGLSFSLSACLIIGEQQHLVSQCGVINPVRRTDRDSTFCSSK